MGEGPAPKHGVDMGPRDVDLVPVHAKDKGTCVSMAAEEGVPNTIAVTERGAATRGTLGSVGVLRAKVDDPMGVHGGEEGTQVARAGGAEGGEGKEIREQLSVTQQGNGEGATWTEEPSVKGRGASEVGLGLPCGCGMA